MFQNCGQLLVRTVEHVAGPGDSIALMGLCAQCGVNIHLFVPPKDAVRPSSNCFYRCIQLLGSTTARKPPTLHITIANGHFTALTNPTRRFVTPSKVFAVDELMKEGTDPATGRYVLTYQRNACVSDVVSCT
jgi:hypothetical protein